MTYPEHEKLQAAKAASQAQGELLAWLAEQDVCLMQVRRKTVVNERSCPHCRYWPPVRRMDERCEPCGNTGLIRRKSIVEDLVPYTKPISKILAEYHGIDERKLEEEKKAMLAALRAAQPGAAA